MTRDMKNSVAYDDCSNYEGPSMPYDKEYMECYRFWREIAQYPEDCNDYWTDDDICY